MKNVKNDKFGCGVTSIGLLKWLNFWKINISEDFNVKNQNHLFKNLWSVCKHADYFYDKQYFFVIGLLLDQNKISKGLESGQVDSNGLKSNYPKFLEEENDPLKKDLMSRPMRYHTVEEKEILLGIVKPPRKKTAKRKAKEDES